MPEWVSVDLCLRLLASLVSKIVSFDVCQELKKFDVNTLVRVCDATYDKAPVEKEGIQVLVRVDTHSLSYCMFILSNSHTYSVILLSPLGLALR